MAYLDQCTKNSTVRLVKSGDMLELYEYERPYFYNLPPPKRNLTLALPEKSNPSCKERREDNLYRARQHLRRVIHSNCWQWGQPPIFITYTFKKNIHNIKQANRFWTQYQKKMRYRYGNLKYTTVIEYQNKRAKKYKEKPTVHYHTIYYNLPYIKNIKKNLGKLWSHGFIHIKATKNIENIGSYVSKYLQKEMLDKRLKNEKVYFSSRGIKKPQEWHKPETINNIKQQYNIKERLSNIYESGRYKIIKYTQYEILCKYKPKFKSFRLKKEALKVKKAKLLLTGQE